MAISKINAFWIGTICLLAFMVFTPPNAHATSAGDTAWRVTDTLEVAPATSYNLPAIDVTQSWSSYITGSTWSAFATEKQYFTDCIANGNWSVTQMEITTGTYAGRKDVIVICSQDSSTTYEFDTWSSVKNIYVNANPHSSRTYLIAYLPGGGMGCNTQTACLLQVSDTPQYPVSNEATDSSGNNYFGYFINGTVNYPTGYAGPTIRSTGVAPPIDPTSVNPSWRYSVADKDITVHSLMTTKEVTDNHIVACLFQIPNNEYGDNYTEYEYDCTSRPTVEHTFEAYGAYNIKNRVQNADGQWFESSRLLTIDGTSFNGIIGGTPSSDSILGALNNLILDTHGLSSVVTAPLAFIAGLPNAVNECAPIALNIANFGTITLPCMTQIYQSRFGALFTIWQTVLIGLFTYHMGIRLFGKIKDMSSPKDDRIEVVNL